MTPRNNIADKGPAIFAHPVAGAVANLDFINGATFIAQNVSHAREVYVGVQGAITLTCSDGTDRTYPNVVGRFPVICIGVKASGSTAQDVTYLF